MNTPEVVSEQQWIEARRVLLVEEKALSDAHDRLAAKRRELPWVKVEKTYVFNGPDGPISLAELFDGRSQLAVYHFMFSPKWEEGCPGCSLLCDQVDGARIHFEHNDLSFVAVSRAPLAKLTAYRERMGWQFRWVSSGANDFNYDFHVSFAEGERDKGVFYNFETVPDPKVDDLPGVSVFRLDDDGTIFHTYSSYGRGGEAFLPVYSWLDITSKGRNEGEGMMSWMKRHDRYETDGRTRAA
jgi:predicted dithiol-disulfide oxidoreductase (DUF899 family)